MNRFKIKHTTRLLSLIIAIAVVAVSLSSVAYAAVDSNIDYSFKISANQAISRDADSRYRGTENNNDAWKVNLRTSEEGTNTATQFSLGLEDKTAASNWQTVQVGSGSHYYSANDAADEEYVYLQARDNNKIALSYKITGWWDEETGVSPD